MIDRRKKLELVGRQCVRAITEGDPYALVIGKMPRDGFPRGSKLRDRADGKLERLYEPEVLLKAVQRWMAKHGPNQHDERNNA